MDMEPSRIPFLNISLLRRALLIMPSKAKDSYDYSPNDALGMNLKMKPFQKSDLHPTSYVIAWYGFIILPVSSFHDLSAVSFNYLTFRRVSSSWTPNHYSSASDRICSSHWYSPQNPQVSRLGGFGAMPTFGKHVVGPLAGHIHSSDAATHFQTQLWMQLPNYPS